MAAGVILASTVEVDAVMAKIVVASEMIVAGTVDLQIVFVYVDHRWDWRCCDSWW